jgi:hypothetical protein
MWQSYYHNNAVTTTAVASYFWLYAAVLMY